MIPIYIFGNDEDETLGQIIKKAISPFGTTVYNTDKHSDEINDTCSFFMKEQEDCSNLKNSVGIAVFKKSFLRLNFRKSLYKKTLLNSLF